jgi:hypothetical protein
MRIFQFQLVFPPKLSQRLKSIQLFLGTLLNGSCLLLKYFWIPVYSTVFNVLGHTALISETHGIYCTRILIMAGCVCVFASQCDLHSTENRFYHYYLGHIRGCLQTFHNNIKIPNQNSVFQEQMYRILKIKHELIWYSRESCSTQNDFQASHVLQHKSMSSKFHHSVGITSL